jgi:hypothetical protein
MFYKKKVVLIDYIYFEKRINNTAEWLVQRWRHLPAGIEHTRKIFRDRQYSG